VKNLGARTLVATGIVGVLGLLWLQWRQPPEARPESPRPTSTPEHADTTTERTAELDHARSTVLETEGPTTDEPASPPVGDVETGTIHLLSASTLAAAARSEW
jgi:cytoskeletal protein RodZ